MYSFNLFAHNFILMSMIMISISALSTSDLIMIWFLMEVSNFLFTSLLSFTVKNKKMIFLYFIIQIIASFTLILSLIMSFNLIKDMFFLMFISLLMKLGIPPLHFWMPLITPFLPWMTLFLLLSIQKIIPFFMMSLITFSNKYNYLYLITACLCAVIPPLAMLNTLNFKTLITYSSINQSGWMLMIIMFKNMLWLYYFMLYMLIIFSLTFMISSFNLTSSNINFNSNKYFNMFILIMMFNIAGMPPMSFFFMKWFSIFTFSINSDMVILLIILMLSSLVMMYIYIKMMTLSMFFWINSSKLLNLSPSSMSYIKPLMMSISIASLIFITAY